MRQRRGTTEGPNCLATSSQVPPMDPVVVVVVVAVVVVNVAVGVLVGTA